MRTTIDIDAPILAELKRVQKREGKSMGKLVSELLALALRSRRDSPEAVDSFKWIVRDMGARIDLRDRDALEEALDQPDEPDPDRR